MPHVRRTAHLLFALCLVMQGTASAQGFFTSNGEREANEDEIETDRDSFTPSTNVVGINRWVAESSYSFIDNRKVPETHSLPELLLRYGLGKRVEMRIGHNYEVGGAGNPVSGNTPDDEEDEVKLEYGARLLYGTKVLLTEQANWIPESSVILQGFTPTSGEDNNTNFAADYVLGWRLPNDCIWDSSLRFATVAFEEDHFNTWSPSTVIKAPIGERWRAHAEYFGVMTEGRAKESTQHFFSPGVHVLLTSDLEVGIRVGWGLNEQTPAFFSNIGIGYRF